MESAGNGDADQFITAQLAGGATCATDVLQEINGSVHIVIGKVAEGAFGVQSGSSELTHETAKLQTSPESREADEGHPAR
jgi:hypothetical protein